MAQKGVTPLAKHGSNESMKGVAASRFVYANDPDRNIGFADNVVITSKYTVWNFLPVFLFQQFSRFANAYFLIVCILQAIPSISITGGIPVSLLPLSFVIFFDGVVTASEDYKRHKDDAHDNAHPTRALRNGQFVTIPWRDVRVGDILRIKRGGVLPADLVFLAASADGDFGDVCYVQTAQLDGETNLKLRQALDLTAGHFRSDAACAAFRGHIECEAPNEFFDKFSGVIQLGTGPDARKEPMEADQTLLRGCVLRNVDFVYGMVVYTGNDTKVRVKQRTATSKKASVESVINSNILTLMVMLALICGIGVVGHAVWSTSNREGHTYLALDAASFLGSIERLFTFFLLNAAFIPVSLYVSMKMARTAQKFFMERDAAMYFEDEELLESSSGEEGQFPMQVRTMDLNDELGRISYIFSDKTGTFTLNYMRFRKLSVGGIAYGLGTTQIGLDRMRRLGLLTDDRLPTHPSPRPLHVSPAHGQRQAAHPGSIDNLDTPIADHELEDAKQEPSNGGSGLPVPCQVQVPHVSFEDGSESHPGRTIAHDAVQEGTPQAEELRRFFLHLVLNHTVIPEKLRNDAGEVIGTHLSASSPDEQAFVYAAEYFGYKFVSRQSSSVDVMINGEVLTFQVLYILNYNQRRKRMSAIVQEPDGRVFLYMKGADSVLYDRLKPVADANDKQVRLDTQVHLANWGNDGLRTLVFGCKELPAEEFSEWAMAYEEARSDMNELAKRKNHQKNKIDDLMDEIEQGCVLQGATANEDQLQPEVPETIELLARSGIKIWMLTGDKQETAVNIGFATKLITDEMEQIIFNTDDMSLDEVLSQLAERAAVVRERPPSAVHEALPWALVIDEKCLDYVLRKAQVDLLDVSKACKAVICCRARPDQKAKMVAMIRKGVPEAFTLAVGDGANDVDMIQEAHVGVGIAGAEGVQAANASDYSIARFKFLQRLLLVHGRWNYNRMAMLVVYMFYKNIEMVLTQYWLSIFTGWSGQKFFIEYATQSYNIFYTGLPILVLAVLDQDVTAENALRFPLLYDDGPKGKSLNAKVFWQWIAAAIVESLLIAFAVMLGYTATTDGSSPHIFELGTLAFAGVVVVTTIRVALITHMHSWLFALAVIISIGSLIPTLLIFDVMNADDMKGGVIAVLSSGTFWAMLPLLAAIGSAAKVTWTLGLRYFQPNLLHIVQEAQIVTKDYKALDEWATSPAAALTSVEERTTTIEGSGSATVFDTTAAGARPAAGAAMTAWGTTKMGSHRSDDTEITDIDTPGASAGAAGVGAGIGAGAGSADATDMTKKLLGSRGSAHHYWTVLQSAGHISFRHRYSGSSFSNDYKSSQAMADRMSGGLKSVSTAPAGMLSLRLKAEREKVTSAGDKRSAADTM